MKLGIVIPALNERLNLGKLLPYLKKNSHSRDVQIIVSDAAGSSDNIELLCNELGVSYIKSDKDQRAAQLNAGAARLECDVIFFVHADVFPPANYYTEIEEAWKEGVAFGMFAYDFDSQSKLLSINARCTRFQGMFCGGGDQCHFVERQFFKKMGGYDEKFEIMEDFDFYRRALKEKVNFKLIKTPALVSARKYENNSYIWVNLINLYAVILFKLGVNPRRIKRMYKKNLS